MVAEVTGVTGDDRRNQRLNASLECTWAAATYAWGNASSDVSPLAGVKLGNPGVDHLAAEPEAVGNLRDALPLIQPQEGLGTSELLGISCPRRQMFQGFSLCRIKGWESHRFTSALRSGVMTQYTPVNRLLRTYLMYGFPEQSG